MSRFIDFRNPLTPVEREMALLGREEQVRNQTLPQYILGNGDLSFEPPSSNVFTNLLQKSARGSIDLGTGAGVVLNSGAGLLSRQFYQIDDTRLPLYEKDGTAVLSDGSVKPVEELSGVDYFKALDPSIRAMLEVHGFSEQNFRDTKSIEDASYRYNNIRRDIFLDQSIRHYNEVNPNWATFTGITNFALDVITDPINLVSFGAGTAAKGGFRAAAKETLEGATAAVGRNMVDGDSVANAIVKADRSGGAFAGFVVEAIDPPAFVTREVVDIDGQVYSVTSKVISQEGDRATYQVSRITKNGVEMPTPGRRGPIVTDPPVYPALDKAPLITPYTQAPPPVPPPVKLPPITLAGRMNKRTGLTDRLQDAYDARLRIELEIKKFMDAELEEVGLDLGLERLGKDINKLKDMETRFNEISREIVKLEKKLDKELAAAYKKRAALDKEFEEFLREGDDFVEVELETGLAYLKQDSDYLKNLDQRYAGVEKTIKRLESPDPHNMRVEKPDIIPVYGKNVEPGKELGPYREQGLALRRRNDKIRLARDPNQSTALARINYSDDILGPGVSDEVAQAIFREGLIPRQSAVGLAVAGGLVFDGLSQYAEYNQRVKGLGADEEFQYSFARAGMSSILTGSLAAIGSIPLGRQPKPITVGSVMHSSPASLAGRRAHNMVRNGSAAEDARISLVELDAITRAERWSEAAYTPEQHNEIMDILTHMNIVEGIPTNPNEYSAFDIGALFSNAPTFLEAKAFLLGGAKGGPATAFDSVLRQIRDLDVKIREAKATGDEALTKSLLKKRAKLQERRRELADTFEFREDTPGYQYRAIVDDVPFTDIYHPESDRLYRLRNLLALRKEDLPEGNQGQIQKLTSKVFGYLSVLGSQGTVARQYQKMTKLGDNPIAQNVARMIAAIDSRIADDMFSGPDGQAVFTVEQNIALFSLRRADFVNTYYKVMNKKSRAEREAIGREVMQARSGTVKESEISEAAKELLPSFSKYYDDMAEIGIRNGGLRSRIDGYVNIQFRDGVTNAQFDIVASKLARYWRKKQFHDRTTDVHYGTLVRIKVLAEDGVTVVNPEKYAKVPRKLSDLDEADLARYRAELDAALLLEAKDAIARRQGRTKGGPEDPVVRAEGRKVQYSPDNRASRVIEQEFWASNEIMDMGIIDTEISEVMKSYERTMGAYLARQETMTNMFGEPVRFEDVVLVLRQEAQKMSNDDPLRADILEAIDALERMGQRAVGHYNIKRTGLEKILQPFLDIASGAIRQGVVIPMSTEVAVTGLSSLIRPSEARLMIRHLREAFNITKVREDLMAMGYAIDYERASDRFFGTSPFDPANSVGRGARWFKENSTIWFGEEALTNRLRRFSFAAFHMRTGRKLMSVVDKLEALDIKLDPNDPKQLKAAARAAGFGGDAAFARDLRRLGLTKKSSRDAIRRFKEIDPDSLNHPTTATRIAMQETDPDLQRSMFEVADALGILSRERTDRFIVKRSSGTEFLSNDALGNALLQFLTYPTSWFNAFLKRGAQGPNHQLAGYMGAYLLGEVVASVLRDVVYKGMTPDEVLDDWEENFYKKMGRIVQRIPIAGPWTDFAVSPVVSLLTGDKPRFSLATTPAGSFAEKTMGGAVSILRKTVKGEPVEVQEVKNTLRMTPIFGSPPAQLLMRDSEE